MQLTSRFEFHTSQEISLRSQATEKLVVNQKGWEIRRFTQKNVNEECSIKHTWENQHHFNGMI